MFIESEMYCDLIISFVVNAEYMTINIKQISKKDHTVKRITKSPLISSDSFPSYRLQKNPNNSQLF